MSFTEFFTSSSVTSTTLQCSSSEGRGSSPCLVTHGCNCRAQEMGKDQGHRNTNQQGCPGIPSIDLDPQPPNPTHTSQCRSLWKGTLRPWPRPTLISDTPILVSGFLSNIFRIRSFSSSLTSGLGRGKAMDEDDTIDKGPFLSSLGLGITLTTLLKWKNRGPSICSGPPRDQHPYANSEG